MVSRRTRSRSSGRFAFFVFRPDRKAEGLPDPATPINPVARLLLRHITADDAAKTLTSRVKVASASTLTASPARSMHCDR